MRQYKLKEIYYTLQGEGFHSGRPAVFIRFTGCNLWTGLEKDRPKAICNFCDTDFVGMDGPNGGKYSALELRDKIFDNWPDNDQSPFIVATGGEPLLQLDEDLIKVLKASNIEIAIETNGTIHIPKGIDWVCVSPKQGAKTLIHAGDEIKLVYPQKDLNPDLFVHDDYKHFYLQPKDGPNFEKNLAASIQYCMDHPKWKLSIQTHKMIGLD
jgi:7-carboxy-7-deazaguanine synthase (Cx14CxxC type)